MARAIVLLLDSFGIGASVDAADFGDESADTFGHIAEYCANGKADVPGLRQGPLNLPYLCSWGLGLASLASTGMRRVGLQYPQTTQAVYGYAVERSKGKDTPSGHWEIAGLINMNDWGYFPEQEPCFPQSLIENLIQQANIPGVLGNKHASGTTIIEELGADHVKTGKPIVYTSADSVFQIAAHEQTFGLDRLYQVCEVARRLVDEHRIGRVIARPFTGEAGSFIRTGNRKDYSTPPHGLTLLDYLQQAGREVVTVGKTADIFAHRGVTQEIKAHGNQQLFDKTLQAMNQLPEGGLIFTNFVDFDTLFGHRRDVPGYAAALEAFDLRLPELVLRLRADDCVVITADHGCDPTLPGSDHTREHIPVLFYLHGIQGGFCGRRETFADIGQTLAAHLNIKPLDCGVPISIVRQAEVARTESLAAID